MLAELAKRKGNIGSRFACKVYQLFDEMLVCI